MGVTPVAVDARLDMPSHHRQQNVFGVLRRVGSLVPGDDDRSVRPERRGGLDQR
jgi:hypothetical protein